MCAPASTLCTSQSDFQALNFSLQLKNFHSDADADADVDVDGGYFAFRRRCRNENARKARQAGKKITLR